MSKRRQGHLISLVIDSVSASALQGTHTVRGAVEVDIINSISHVIITERLHRPEYIEARCDPISFAEWMDFVSLSENSPEILEEITGIAARDIRDVARSFAASGDITILYAFGVIEHPKNLTTFINFTNLAMATGNCGSL